jgi:hypothetical protein
MTGFIVVVRDQALPGFDAVDGRDRGRSPVWEFWRT